MASKSPRKRIAGRHHPLLKAVRRMVRAGERSPDGQVLLETPRLIEDALASGVALSHVVVSESPSQRVRRLLPKLSSQTAIYEAPPRILAEISSTETSQGIWALAAAPKWREEDLFRRQPALLLVLSGLQDPGNLGTILRTAEAFGATGVLLTRGTVSAYNVKAVRATAGALLRLPLLEGLTEAEAVALLERHRVRLFAAVVGGEGQRLRDAAFSGPVAIAIGAEGAGLGATLQAAGEPLRIPMAPAVESLNAAVAAAVILYEIARQRGFPGKD